MEDIIQKRAKVFKALSDEKRLRILDYLKHGEKCACKLTEELDIPQSALSYHMKILCEAGIIDKREEGKWSHYSISEKGGRDIINMLQEMISVTDTMPQMCKKLN